MKAARLVNGMLQRRGRALLAMCSLVRFTELVAIFAAAVSISKANQVLGLSIVAAGACLVVIRGFLSTLLLEEARQTLFGKVAAALLAALHPSVNAC